MERLECEIEMENGRWKWRRVSGEIRMWDRDGEGKMENEEELVEKLEWEIELVEKLEWEIDEWVIKGGRSELGRENFLEEKILDVW